MHLGRVLLLPLWLCAACREPRPPLPRFEHPVPTVSRRELLERLEARDWDGLDSRFAELEARARSSPGAEPDLSIAYDAFRVSTPEVGELLATFADERPQSATAHLLLAEFRVGSGWRARGSKWSHETTDAQFRKMADWHGRAEVAATRALELDPDRIEGEVLRIDLAQAHGTLEDCRSVAERALARRPTSLRVRAALFDCLLPRWGGSYGQMDEAARSASPMFADNPRLAVLFGFADADRADRTLDAGDCARALELADRALETGEYASFYFERGRALRELDRPSLAIAAFTRALELRPETPRFLVHRADAYLGVGDMDSMRRDHELVRAVDPLHPDLRWFERRVEAREQGRLWAESLGFQKVLDRGQSAWEAGKKEEAYNVLGWAALLDPTSYEASRSLDVAAVERENYEYSVRIWTRYLKVRPADARALVARASSLEELGEREAATVDLRAACELGDDDACRRARRR